MTINSKNIVSVMNQHDYGLDFENQILIYTGYYLHNDGTIHNYPEEV